MMLQIYCNSNNSTYVHSLWVANLTLSILNVVDLFLECCFQQLVNRENEFALLHKVHIGADSDELKVSSSSSSDSEEENNAKKEERTEELTEEQQRLRYNKLKTETNDVVLLFFVSAVLSVCCYFGSNAAF